MTDVLPSGLETSEFSSDTRPQDDLYRHVNGAWLARTEIPGDKARWGSFHLLAEQAEKDVRTIIEESQDAEGGTLARKIGDLFASFMDTERIAAAGVSPLADTLAEIDAIDDVAAFLRTVGAYDRDGRAHLIGLYIEPDPGNPERYVPFLVQSGLSLPDESYYRLDTFEGTRAAYRAHLERLLALAGVADAATQADRSIALEGELAAHHWDNVRSRDAVATYNLKTWDEIQALVGVDLTPWREAVAPNNDGAFAEAVVYQPSFLEGLGTLLAADRLDDWKAWLRAQVVHAAAPYLTDEIVQENFSFYGTELTGVPTIRERWKRGVSVTEGALGEAIGKVYVERHYPPTAKAAM
ncbi:MAG: M13 family metallopeptidase N-terminal domain-containing protein, partial [Microbacterium sp.]